jgi:hypothetical protein
MFFKSENSFIFLLDRLGGESHERGFFLFAPFHKRPPWVFFNIVTMRTTRGQQEDNVAFFSIDNTIICSVFTSVECELLYFTHVDY